MKYKIAIPSARRCNNSKNFRTIDLLRSIGLDMHNVFLFLDKDEVDIYKKNYNLEDVSIVETTNTNIVQIRNYIEKEHFDNGEHIVCMDDDLIYLNYKTDNGISKIKDFDTFDMLIQRAYKLAIQNNCLLWGVYPIGRNHMWMQQATTKIGNNHILATFSGVIINKGLKLQDIKYRVKEEYERAFIYGKNIKFDWIGMHTKYYCVDGIGLRSFDIQQLHCDRLFLDYPHKFSQTPMKYNKHRTTCDCRLKLQAESKPLFKDLVSFNND